MVKDLTSAPDRCLKETVVTTVMSAVSKVFTDSILQSSEELS